MQEREGREEKREEQESRSRREETGERGSCARGKEQEQHRQSSDL